MLNQVLAVLFFVNFWVSGYNTVKSDQNQSQEFDKHVIIDYDTHTAIFVSVTK